MQYECTLNRVKWNWRKQSRSGNRRATLCATGRSPRIPNPQISSRSSFRASTSFKCLTKSNSLNIPKCLASNPKKEELLQKFFLVRFRSASVCWCFLLSYFKKYRDLLWYTKKNYVYARVCICMYVYTRLVYITMWYKQFKNNFRILVDVTVELDLLIDWLCDWCGQSSSSR